jgi:hypothetical protein
MKDSKEIIKKETQKKRRMYESCKETVSFTLRTAGNYSMQMNPAEISKHKRHRRTDPRRKSSKLHSASKTKD